MTAPIEEFVRLTRRTQEALGSAVQAWQQTALSTVERSGVGQPGLPDVRATIDAAFTFAARVLADQLEFAKALAAVATPGQATEDRFLPAPPAERPTKRATRQAEPARRSEPAPPALEAVATDTTDATDAAPSPPATAEPRPPEPAAAKSPRPPRAAKATSATAAEKRSSPAKRTAPAKRAPAEERGSDDGGAGTPGASA